MSRSVIPMMMQPTLLLPTAPATSNHNSMNEDDETMPLVNLESTSSLSSSTTIVAPPREFYVVQRCWYSGPRQDVAPVDYLRLLETREEAQEASFHSAMAWSGLPSHLLGTVPVRNHQEDQVETTTAYAACGSLFWIRRIWGATMNYASSSSSTEPFRFNYQHQHYQHYNHGEQPTHDHFHHSSTTAFAVLTEGVIGGTGNRNSRRGVEISTGRVFLGNPIAARAAALQVARELQRELLEEHGHYQHHHHNSTSPSLPPNIQVVAIPIGSPAEYVTKRFVQEWYHPLTFASTTTSSSSSSFDTAASSPSTVTPVALSTTTMTSARPAWKRSWSDPDVVVTCNSLDSVEQQQQLHHDRHVSAEFVPFAATAENHTFVFPPMSKRPRRCGSVLASPGSDDETAMDMAVCWS